MTPKNGGKIELKLGPSTPESAEYEAHLKVVATGGLAPLFSEGTTIIEKIDPDITLEGLRLLAERNPVPTLQRTVLRDSL